MPGLAPGHAGAVSKPGPMLVHMIYKRAEPLLTCAAPRSEGKGLHPSVSPVAMPFPKRKSRSIPSIRAVSWQCSLNARAKVEHHKPTYCPFVPVFSGIDCE